MKRPLIILLLLIFCAASVVLSLFTGGTEIPAGQVLSALYPSWGDSMAHTLIWELRIPRILTAGIVGAA
ncbi:iron ABC transporter permease, partial [bacterium]|nr:iron ABC transporter permease [bacterium]